MTMREYISDEALDVNKTKLDECNKTKTQLLEQIDIADEALDVTKTKLNKCIKTQLSAQIVMDFLFITHNIGQCKSYQWASHLGGKRIPRGNFIIIILIELFQIICQTLYQILVVYLIYSAYKK